MSGRLTYNETRAEHGIAPVGVVEYLGTGHFWEATSENWESEFLQMGLFVLLTVWLRQKGSSESKGFEGKDESEEDPREHARDTDAPWPVHRGGWVLALYEHLLSLALLSVFVAAFIAHAWGGLRETNADRAMRGLAPEGFLELIGSAEFWFQSLQNWQSEFLSVAAVVVLAIVLRERGSSQSKPVAAPHDETG